MDREDQLRTIVVLLSIIASILTFAALSFARDVVIPFALAVFAAYAVEPIVRALARFRVPRWIGALIVVGLLFVGVQGVAGVLAGSLQELEARLPTYLASLQGLLDLVPLGAAELGRVHLDDPAFWAQLFPVDLVAGNIGSWAGAITAFIGSAMLVLLLMVAVIIARQRFDRRLEEVASRATGHEEEAVLVIHAIDDGIQRYMQLKTLLSLANGLLFGLVLMLFGVDFAVLWGFLLFVLNYIPAVGPVLATIPPVVVLAIQYADQPAIAIVGVFCAGAVPTAFANLVEPKVFGDSLNLNFFAVIFALLLWTYLWGLPGAVLSVPMTMALSLVCREVPALRPFHDLLRA